MVRDLSGPSLRSQLRERAQRKGTTVVSTPISTEPPLA
jgi:hypothetical protein